MEKQKQPNIAEFLQCILRETRALRLEVKALARTDSIKDSGGEGSVQFRPIRDRMYYVPCGAPATDNARPFDFDTWMRERTDAAHAAYMARHSARGR